MQELEKKNQEGWVALEEEVSRGQRLLNKIQDALKDIEESQIKATY